MLRLVAIVFLLVAMSKGAHSEEPLSADEQFYHDVSVDEDAVFKNWGVGAFSCVNYIDAREFPDSPIGSYDATFRQWLMGFITAFNIKDRDTRDLLGRTSVERVMKWIDSYCYKNKEDDFFTAVWQFTKIAYPYRAKQAPDMAKR